MIHCPSPTSTPHTSTRKPPPSHPFSPHTSPTPPSLAPSCSNLRCPPPARSHHQTRPTRTHPRTSPHKPFPPLHRPLPSPRPTILQGPSVPTAHVHSAPTASSHLATHTTHTAQCRQRTPPPSNPASGFASRGKRPQSSRPRAYDEAAPAQNSAYDPLANVACCANLHVLVRLKLVLVRVKLVTCSGAKPGHAYREPLGLLIQGP